MQQGEAQLPCSPHHTAPSTGGSVEGVLVFHCPGPAPGTVSLVVVLGTGGRGLRPALGAVAAAPGALGTLQAVVGCRDRDSGGRGHSLSGRWRRRARGCCAAEVVWRWQVDPAAGWLRHEGWRGAGVCKGNKSLTPRLLPLRYLPTPPLSNLDPVLLQSSFLLSPSIAGRSEPCRPPCSSPLLSLPGPGD